MKVKVRCIDCKKERMVQKKWMPPKRCSVCAIEYNKRGDYTRD